ncbi:hypothetical protein A6C57_14295 [Fibrella sp. ES10-3-2-2]
MHVLRQLALSTVLVAVWACSSPRSDRQPPNLTVANTDTLLRKMDDGWRYNGQPFSGYMVEKEINGRIVYKLPIIDGYENGLAIGWYTTGEKLLERLFIEGKKEDTFRQWWPNGKLRYVFRFHDDQYHGSQFVYFPSGRKREESTYQNGEKEGLQRAWNETGQLVSNYTVRNGRTYGIVSVESCMPVSHL